MELDTDKIDQAVLALLALGRHEGYRTWKAFDWEVMSRLHEKGYISDPVGKTKSVLFTEEGARESERLPQGLVRPIARSRLRRDHTRPPAHTMKRKSARDAPTELEPSRTLLCHTCGRAIAGFESVHYGSMEGGYRDLCNRCFNEEVAETGGIDFSHVQFEPLEISDAAGTPHRFHFEVDLLGDRVVAAGLRTRGRATPGAMSFRCSGDAEAGFIRADGPNGPADPPIALSAASEDRPHMPGLHIADFMVRGRITWDDNEDGRLPMLVIDGKEISWDQLRADGDGLRGLAV